MNHNPWRMTPSVLSDPCVTLFFSVFYSFIHIFIMNKWVSTNLTSNKTWSPSRNFRLFPAPLSYHPDFLPSGNCCPLFFLKTVWSCICCCLVAKSCPTLWNLLGCSPPGSSLHGILQERILEWVAISFWRRSVFPTQGLEPHLLSW